MITTTTATQPTATPAESATEGTESTAFTADIEAAAADADRNQASEKGKPRGLTKAMQRVKDQVADRPKRSSQPPRAQAQAGVTETELRPVASVPQQIQAAAAASAAAQRPTPTKTNSASSPTTKADLILKKLRTPRGATLPALMEETGWQAHSVRGFLSGTVRKRLGLDLTSAIGKDGVRRYRLAAHA